jgi:soluble cytochrome b562
MSVRFIQASCIEGKKVDPRQAAVVKKYKPDIIFFETPSFGGNPSSPFNHYSAKNKPFAEVEKIKKGLRKAAKKTPYALSDVFVWENIESLWREGHNVLLFNIDAPQELRQEGLMRRGHVSLSRAKRTWEFWAYVYVRETIMAHFMEQVLKKRFVKRKIIAAVFLQSFHWQHVKFLLKHSSKEKIWRYYFGKFPKLNPVTITRGLKTKLPILSRYWGGI